MRETPQIEREVLAVDPDDQPSKLAPQQEEEEKDEEEEEEMSPLLKKDSGHCGLLNPWYAHLELQGAFWYFAPSAGYVIYDVLFGVFPLYCATPVCVGFVDHNDFDWLNNFISVFLAAMYMLDAIIYWLALVVHDSDNAAKFLFWSSELCNTCASALYLASQALYYHPDFESETLHVLVGIAVMQSVMYFLGNLLWSINSFQYVLVWKREREGDPRKEGRVLAEMGCWAEIFNVWPCLGYTLTSLWALIVMFDYMSDYTTFRAFWDRNQAFQLVINIAWDAGFVSDAILYGVLWNRDRTFYASSS